MKPKLILGKKVGGYVHNKDMRKDYIAAWMNGLNVAIWPRPTLLVAGSEWDDISTHLALPLDLPNCTFETSCHRSTDNKLHCWQSQLNCNLMPKRDIEITPCGLPVSESRIKARSEWMVCPSLIPNCLLWIVMVDSQISVSLREHLLPISSLYRGKARNDLTPRRWNLWFSGTFLGPFWDQCEVSWVDICSG
jgi:hypothetical protein